MKRILPLLLLLLSVIASPGANGSNLGCASLTEMESWPEVGFSVRDGQTVLPSSLADRVAAFYLQGADSIVVGAIEVLPRANSSAQYGNGVVGEFVVRLKDGKVPISGLPLSKIRVKPLSAMTAQQVRKYAGWRKIQFRVNPQQLQIPRFLVGMRAVIVLPDDARNTFGVPSLEGVIEKIPRWQDRTTENEAGVIGDFELRLDDGKLEKISWKLLDDLKVDPPGIQTEIIQ